MCHLFFLRLMLSSAKVLPKFSLQKKKMLAPHPRRLLFTRGMNTECPICLEPLRRGFLTPCGHTFHCACLRRHMSNSSKCPMCRAGLPVDWETVLADLAREETLLIQHLEHIAFLRLWIHARRARLLQEFGQD